MRFRQIHLDFHTSPFIPEIGGKFHKIQWQATLREAAVDSVTLFATCHHGYAYYDSELGNRHPHLDFDLLRAQMDACHEIGIATSVYLTAGYNDYAYEQHPEWLEIPFGQKSNPNLTAAFKKMCFNTAYLDFLCTQISEVLRKFPDADGIFLDIICQNQCCCPKCVEGMVKSGLNPEDEEDRKKFARQVLLNYYRRTTDTVKSICPAMRIFHNSGHISINDHEAFPFFSHYELESLPTGGWGYDHFPMSAAYSRNLGKEFLGMTGKFHTTWGEFGGLKTPEALKYECSAMLAHGSKCSIGDQLHPSGKLDSSTYEIIGRAYREVREKEPWCGNVTSAAETAILSAVIPERPPVWREAAGDSGASRVLLEAHIPFDVVDSRMEWSRYRFLVLADDVRITPELAEKLESFRAGGGKLILSGKSGMDLPGEKFLLKNLPFEHEGQSPFCPDYIQGDAGLTPDYCRSPFVMYLRGERIIALEGCSLGKVFDPYFNRTYQHYSSHQHTPYIDQPTPYDCGAVSDGILYFAHPVFSIYRTRGQVVLKEFIARAMRRFMGDELQLDINMPSQGRVTLMKQEQEGRYILHCLYANTILRGGEAEGFSPADSQAVKVIDELMPCPPLQCSLKLPVGIRSVRLVPSGIELPFTHDGRLSFRLPAFTCHQMVEITAEV